MSQGRQANRHGGDNEDHVAMILSQYGKMRPVNIGEARGTTALRAMSEAFQGQLYSCCGVFAQQTPLCMSIHETSLREDFLLYRPEWPGPIALSCKHQYRSGTAVEKLEYLYANIMERFPCRCIVVLEGNIFGPAVIRRAHQWVEKSNGKIACVMQGVGDVRRWATDGCPWPPEPLQTLMA